MIKLAHISIIKDKENLPWKRNHLTLCGSNDITDNTVESFIFCTLPNDMRCQACKYALLEMLNGDK